MKPDRTIIEGIDACRPGSDDLHLAELAKVASVVNEDPDARDLYERTQQSDSLVQEAFHKVDVPAGLEDRLLASLGLVEEGLTECFPEPAANSQASQPTRRGHFTTLLTLATLLVVSIGVGVWVLRPTNNPLTTESILAEVGDFRLAEADATHWSEDFDQVRETHPYSLRVTVKPLAWHTAAGLGDRNGVAYQVEANGQRKATLYAFRTSLDISQLPLAPPAEPLRQGSDVEVGIWRSAASNTVYVFVVEGPDAGHRYGQYLSTSGIVASLLSPQTLRTAT